MQVHDIEIKYKQSSSKKNLYALGDIHCGTIHCVEDEVKAKVAEISKDKDGLWIGMGDYGEFITPRDKRWDGSQKAIAEWLEPDNIARNQTDWIVKLFKPIKDKCVGLLYGNHEESMRRFNHDNVHQNICDDLGVKNLGYSCFIRLFFRRENSNESHLIKGCFTHGSGAAITEGAKINRLIRWMLANDAHLYGYGHMHDIITKTKPYLALNDKSFGQSSIIARESVGAVTGSWFRTYTQGITASYGEIKSFPPTTIGCPVFVIDIPNQSVEVHKS
jgi:hypothetical protein